MSSSPKTAWLIPAGLIALSIVPAAAGVFRLLQLAVAADITPNNARFFAAPVSVVLHVVSALLFCIVGAIQFSPALRRRGQGWHRAAGRGVIPCGLVAALSGLWMTQFYPSVELDGRVVYAMRLLAGSAMALFLCLGLAAVRRRDFSRHGAWMMRGYALGLGAGTQVLTHLPWSLLPCIQADTARTLAMAAGWAINLAVAESLIWRSRQKTGFERRPHLDCVPGAGALQEGSRWSRTGTPTAPKGLRQEPS